MPRSILHANEFNHSSVKEMRNTFEIYCNVMNKKSLILCVCGVIIAFIVLAAYGFALLEKKIFDWRIWQQSKEILTQQENRKDELDLSIQKILDELSFSCDEDDKKILSSSAMKSRYIMLAGLITADNKSCTSLGGRFIFQHNELIPKSTARNQLYFFNVRNEIDTSGQLAIAYTDIQGTLFFILGADSFYSLLDKNCVGCFYVDFFFDGRSVFGVGEKNIKKEPSHSVVDYFNQDSLQGMKLYAGDNLRADVDGFIRQFSRVFIGISSLLLVVVLIAIKLKNRTLNAKLKYAMRNKEIYPFYQPIFDVKLQRFVGAEVLVRWRHNEEWISPTQFIPYAEEKDLIIPITDVIIRRAEHDMAQLPNDFWYSINISAKHFVNEQLIHSIMKMKFKGSNAQRVSFEITERHPISDIESAKKQIGFLSARGYHFKLDDFGTGYGGVAYLQVLGIRSIKIDKMFVDTIGTDDFKFGALESIIAFGIESDYQMIAEGVETKEQADFLYSKGVFLHQGYFYAKPMSIKKLLAFI